MKPMMTLSAIFFLFATLVNADTQLPSCKLNMALNPDGSVLTKFGTLIVPEGLTPGAQYFVYAYKWASNHSSRIVGIFTADADGKTMIDLPLEDGDYYLGFQTANNEKGGWGVPCLD